MASTAAPSMSRPRGVMPHRQQSTIEAGVARAWPQADVVSWRVPAEQSAIYWLGCEGILGDTGALTGWLPPWPPRGWVREAAATGVLHSEGPLTGTREFLNALASRAMYPAGTGS